MINLGSKTIETDRLILKAQTMDEQYYLWSLLMLPEVNKYCVITPKDQIHTKKEYIEKIKDWSKQEPLFKEFIKIANEPYIYYWSIFLKETGECIGRISCQSFFEEGYNGFDPTVRDVGWFIDPKHMRKGYGTEAASAMIEYMFLECDIECLITCVAVDNPASWKIMKKIGFKEIGKTKSEYTFLDEPVDVYQLYLTKKMYLEKNNEKTR